MKNYKKLVKIENDPTKHYPNKNEGDVLRKIMAETKLTEEEVRDIKKYRKMLSDASKSGEKEKSNPVVKWYRGKIKDACKITGLAPQHPKTIIELQKILDRTQRMPFRIMIRTWSTNILKAKTVVRDYAKK